MNDFIAKFGQVVYRLRNESGITQEAFAKKANITRCYISSIENGKRSPTLPIMMKIANTLDVPLSQILLEIENNSNK